MNDNLIGGGVEKLLNDLLPLINKEYCCDLLILTYKGEKYRRSLHHAGIQVKVIPEKYHSHIQKIVYIKRFIERGNYDIVHANEFPMVYYCSIAKRLMGKPAARFVMTEHDTNNRRRNYPVLKPLERWIYDGYERVISISKGTEDALLKWLGRRKTSRRFVVIENGIPLKKFRKAEPYEKKDIFPEYSKEDIILCMVGRFDPKKNHLFMLDVLERLPPNYRLVFVGDGVMEDTVKKAVSNKALEKRTYFLGFRSDVASIMKTADVIVIPSQWEGFGLIAVEAMACNKPIVCSDVPGLADIVGNGGIKASLKDEKKFADAIRTLEVSETYQSIVGHGMKQAKKFDLMVMKNRYMSVYYDLMREVKD